MDEVHIVLGPEYKSLENSAIRDLRGAYEGRSAGCPL